MKQPFRYFRAEFNGKYLYNLVTCPNHAVQGILDELVYQTLAQWKSDDEVNAKEMPIREKDLISIAKIAGLFWPLSYGYKTLGSILFTHSHVVNGEERSERGLLDMYNENIRFVREEYDDYPDDIVNDASEERRMSLVPKDTEPVGYLPYGTELFTQDGDVINENLLDNPPTDGTPYTTYYGKRFLTFEETFFGDIFLPAELFKSLFECIQRVRYNGPTAANFMDITRSLGAGYIHDINIVPQGRFYFVYYRTNNNINISNAISRLNMWFYICAQQFKLFVPIEYGD